MVYKFTTSTDGLIIKERLYLKHYSTQQHFCHFYI
jgi:hypothetical protein